MPGFLWGVSLALQRDCDARACSTPAQHAHVAVRVQAKKGERAACCLLELELCAQEQPQDAGRLQAALDAWDAAVGVAAGGWASPHYITVRQRMTVGLCTCVVTALCQCGAILWCAAASGAARPWVERAPGTHSAECGAPRRGPAPCAAESMALCLPCYTAGCWAGECCACAYVFA